MGIFSITSNAAPVVVYNYCYEGIWDVDDEIHNCPTPCGSITYLDSEGNIQTITNISINSDVITISAQSIISTVGVSLIDCI